MRVSVADPQFGSCVDRVDAWFCSQQPFGILKWKLTVLDSATSEELLTETWTTAEPATPTPPPDAGSIPNPKVNNIPPRFPPR